MLCLVGGGPAGVGEEPGDGVGGGVGDGGVEGGLAHGVVPEDLDVEGGEQVGLNGFGQFVEPAGEGGQQVGQVDVGGRRGLPGQAGNGLPWAEGVARTPNGLIPLLDLAALGARFTETSAA